MGSIGFDELGDLTMDEADEMIRLYKKISDVDNPEEVYQKLSEEFQ